MDVPTTTALGAPHESFCKTETTPTSPHHEPGDIRANKGGAGKESDYTVSNNPKQDMTQTQTTKKFCTFAVNNGLTDSPGLPPELRLMVYKAAFPEMEGSIVYEEFSRYYTKNKLVFIGPVNHCDNRVCLRKDLRPWDQGCARCVRTPKNDQLRVVLESNFARDPATRFEFLTEYVRRV